MRPIYIKSGTMDQKTKLNRSRSDLLLLEEFSTRDLDSSQTSVFALKKQQPTAIEKIDEEMTARDNEELPPLDAIFPREMKSLTP